jgi:hypothetical protein
MAREVQAMSSMPNLGTDLPNWARRVDNYTESDARAPRVSSALGSIVVNLVLLYAAQHVLDWQISWITPAWAAVLWAVDLTLWVSIVTNILFLAFDAAWLRNLAGAISCSVAAFATWWVFAVFPFDLGSTAANDVGRLGLVAVMLATAVAALVMAVLSVVKLLR